MSKDYFGELEEEDVEIKIIPVRKSNYEGSQHGKWLVVKKISTTEYLCRCDCGAEITRNIYSVKKNGTGCRHCYKKSQSYQRFKDK